MTALVRRTPDTRLARPLFAATLLALVLAAPVRAAERSDVPAKYRWDLTAMYPSEAAWTTARDALSKRIPRLAAFKGRLGVSADSLEKALDQYMDVSRDLSRLYTYASMLADEDTRIARHMEMRESASRLGVDLRTTMAYLRPELLAIGAEKIHRFVAANPGLRIYRVYLDDVLRYAPHTRTQAEETIIAQAGRMSNSGLTIRGLFNNAELPYPTVTLPNGKTVRIDDAAYTEWRQDPDRAVRDSVFHAFYRTRHAYEGTFGAALDAQVQAHVFNRDVRKFKTCLEDALFGDAIPVRVYTQLIDDAHANLPTLHRFLRLKQRMLKVKQLRYEDLYTALVPSVELSYTPEQAMDVVLAAVAPLGRAYVDTLRHGFDSRWVDWMPSTGKSSGAYSTGAYGVHPYQLQNFTGKYDEVGTLAHESGHSMHTYLSATHQPYVTADYATFVAEVASTLNENLLFHHMYGRTADRATKLWLLGDHLDNLRTTLFRQALFAEFELRIHEMSEKGQPLTGEALSKLYLSIVRRWYGHDAGVCKVDELYSAEWTYIEHFFYDFYVFQYSTSIVASTALANGIRSEMKSGSTAKRDAYLRMLQSGSSKHPVDLLKDAGVDMTTSAPFKASIAEMNRTMDEMEKLLAAGGGLRQKRD